MANDTVSIGENLRHELSTAINRTISARDCSGISHSFREIAAETIHDVVRSWSTYPALDENSADEDRVLEKLHFVYAAAARLYEYSCYAQPDSLPNIIVACFTNQIKTNNEVTVGMMGEILQAASEVEAEQTKLVDSAMETEKQARLEMSKRKERLLSGEQIGGNEAVQHGRVKKRNANAKDYEVWLGLDGLEAKASKPTKKKAKVAGDEGPRGTPDDIGKFTIQSPHPKGKGKAKVNGAPTVEPTDVDGGEGEDVEDTVAILRKSTLKPKKTKAKTTGTAQFGEASSTLYREDANAAWQELYSDALTGPTEETLPKKSGMGNWGHTASVRWYPDEIQWMENQIAANLWMTWKEHADANTAEWTGKEYSDEFGVVKAVRQGRGGDGIRQQFSDFKREQVKAQGQIQGASTGNAGDANTTASAGGAASGNAGVSRKGGDDDADTGSPPSNAAVQDASSPAEASKAPASRYGRPVKIYAVGKVVRPTRYEVAASSTKSTPKRKKKSKANSTAQHREDDDGYISDVPVRSEPGSEEDPLGDLEEMVARVKRGEL